jgi:ABC-type uncharacterized transport system permease subunit
MPKITHPRFHITPSDFEISSTEQCLIASGVIVFAIENVKLSVRSVFTKKEENDVV